MVENDEEEDGNGKKSDIKITTGSTEKWLNTKRCSANEVITKTFRFIPRPNYR